MSYPLPPNEADRLGELDRYEILSTSPEPEFDRFTQLAARLFHAPIAILNLIAEDKQFFKSCFGMDLSETTRDISICTWAILSPEVMVMPDVRDDPRFTCNPFVLAENGIRFYAGAPLITPRGFNLGTLCVIDSKPRHEGLSADDISTLQDLAALVVSQLELRLAMREAERAHARERESGRLLAERARFALLGADVGVALTDTEDLSTCLSGCAKAMVRNLDAAFARVWTLNPAGDTLELQASAGLYTHLNGAHARIPVGKFKIGLIAAERRPHLTNDVVNDPRVSDRDWARREGIASFAGYPLVVEDQLMGVLGMFARDPMPVEALGALDSVAHSIAVSISRRREEAERKRIAKELACSNADLEKFAFAASHDLKEPLRMVHSYAQLLARNYKGRLDEDATLFIEFIQDGTSRMNAIIQGLLSFATVGHDEEEFQLIDSEESLSQALTNCKALIEESRAEVVRRPLPRVRASLSQLTSVFQNLISNAAKYRRADAPRIEIGARKHEKAWMFSVRDNGVGIHPDYHQKIFEMFQRLDRTRSRGAGIGLALCKRVIENHNGRIWVESTPGQGSTFLFTIPA